MEQLSLRHVYKMYLDGCSAVLNVSADIEPSEFFVLLGPSKAGKSSLLRMISGTETVTRGQILLGDTLMNGLSPGERPVQMLVTDYSLYPYLTVYDNIAFRLKLSHIPSPAIRAQVHSIAQMLEIEHLLDRMPKALTLWEKLLTTIGRLLIRKPKLLLLDEPMKFFPLRARKLAINRLVHLQRRLDIPFVYATADVQQAEMIGGRALLLMEGKALQCGTVEEMRCQPSHLKVARFLSNPPLNICPAQLKIEAEKAILEFGNGKNIMLSLDGTELLARSSTGSVGESFTVGVYPQRLRCTVNGDEKGLLSGTVCACTEHGKETFVQFKSEGMDWVGRLEPGNQCPAKGENVTGNLTAADLMLFDKDDEIVI